jgi:acetyltransferase
MRIYPKHLVRMAEWQGGRVLIRPVIPEDACRLIAASLLCSAQDLRFRFLRSMGRISERFAAAQLTQIDYERTIGFVAEGVSGEILATARLVRDACAKTAEFALIVRTDLQKSGLGTIMQNVVEEHAIKLGLSGIWGVVDCENRRALSFFRSLGYQVSYCIDSPFPRLAKALA